MLKNNMFVISTVYKNSPSPVFHNKNIHTGIYIHPHMFRHTAATLAYKQTHDLIGIQEMLEHTRVETTRIYTHSDTDSKRKLVEASPLNSILKESE